MVDQALIYAVARDITDRKADEDVLREAKAEAERAREEADIEALLATHGRSLNAELLRSYFRLFDRERDFDRLLADAKKR